MSKQLVIIGFLILLIIFAVQPAAALSGKGVVQLKKAGVSDQTIAVIAKEKVIETAAFSRTALHSQRKDRGMINIRWLYTRYSKWSPPITNV